MRSVAEGVSYCVKHQSD